MSEEWRNLAPDLVRQRVIIEGTTEEIVGPNAIKEYLIGLATITKMEVLSGPFSYSAHEMGYGGWIHWKTSGAHVYSYPTNPPLVTVDCYTCQPFSVREASSFTKDFFKCIDIVHKEIQI